MNGWLKKPQCNLAFSIISIYKTVSSIIFHLTFSYLNDMICHQWSRNYSFCCYCLQISSTYSRLSYQTLETIALRKVSGLDDYFCRYVTCQKMMFCLYKHRSCLRCKLLDPCLYDWREQQRVTLVERVESGSHGAGWCAVNDRTVLVRDDWKLELDRYTWTEDKVGRKVTISSTKYFRGTS